MPMPPEEDKDGRLLIGGLELGPGDRIGSFVYERIIGRGGMAYVLLARDPVGQPVALKVLRASRLNTGQVRFKREFRALARIQHPNVIRVDSTGDIFGHPYIAMEYVEGRDLHQVVRSFKQLPPEIRWKRCERILVDLCRALAHIHRRGLVHRDLKPSNILIDRQGRAKLTDFGIVKDLDPGADPNISNTLVGTWAYASPEQISGQHLDHRSDLFSLGVILFVMITGRRPFVAKDIAGYLELHREHTPPRPAQLVPGVPDHLNEICARLMQKSPRARFQAAQEVLYRLERAGAQPSPAPVTRGWEPPLVGRTVERSALQEAIAQLTTGEGGVIWILGSVGCGRTRLLELAEEHARRLGFPVHRTRPQEAGGAFFAVERIAGELASDLGTEFPPELTQAIASFTRDKGRVRGDLRYRVLDGLRFALERALESGPRLLVVDDLHRAPPPLLDLLAFISRTVVAFGGPLLIVGTARTDIPSPNADNLQDAVLFGLQPALIEPGPLGLGDLQDMLEGMLGDAPGTRALAARLHRETEGNPLFLSQFLQTLVQRGIMVRGPGGLALAIDTEEVAAGHLEIPAGIRNVLGERLEALSGEQREVLDVVAVNRRELDVDVLLDVLGQDEDSVLDRVDALMDARILVEHRAGPLVNIDFSHGKFGDLIYRDLRPDKRVALHRRLAAVHEERSGRSVSAARLIGEHYRRGGEAGKAYLHLVLATQRFHERSLIGEATKLAEQAVAVEDTARGDLNTRAYRHIRMGLLSVRADIAYGRGEWRQAREHFEEALQLAQKLRSEPDGIRARLGLGRAQARLGQDSHAAELREGALAAARELGDRELLTLALRDMAGYAWEGGDLDACRRLVSEGLVLAVGPEHEGHRAELLMAQAVVESSQGHIASATRGLTEAESIFKELGIKRYRCLALANLCEFHTWQGSLAMALNCGRRAQMLAREVLYRVGEGVAARASGMVSLNLGLYDEARERLEEALSIVGPLKVKHELIAARYALGRFHLQHGQFDLAERHLSVARGLAAQKDAEGYLPLIQATLAHVFARAGDGFQAEQVLRQALKQQGAVPLPRHVQSLTVAAAAYARLGDPVQAHRVAARAADQARARGLKLWALDALQVLARHSPKPATSRRALGDARRLAQELHRALPGSLARSFAARPGVAGLLD